MSIQEEPFRLGMVGCGSISHYHAGAAAMSPHGLRFVACCDIREEAAKEFCQRFGGEDHYTDYCKMIREQSLDGIVLATWPNQHREQVERCFEAGARNILCEKALAMSGREALEIQTLVNDAGALLMEGFMYRHHPAIRRIEWLVASGEVGVVDSVHAVFNYYDPETASVDDPTRDWRQRRECGGGVSHDYACYASSACNAFARGLPRRAYATGTTSSQYGTINRLFGLIEYDSGCIGIVESSKKACFSEELQISGSAGIINLPKAWNMPEDAVFEVRHIPGWAQLYADTHTVAAANSYQLQLENFADAVRGRAEPLVTLDQSVTNCLTIDALVRSMNEGRSIEIALPAHLRSPADQQAKA